MTSPPLTPFPAHQRLQHFWVRHRWMDLALGLLVGVTWFAATSWCWFPENLCRLPQALTAVPPDARRVAFQIVAAGAATMGGFTLTSVSILVNLLRTPLSTIDRLLPAADKTRVGSVFLSALPWLLALFIVALVALTTDTNVPKGYWGIQLLTISLLVSTTLALARVVWVLRRLLSVSAD